MAVRLPTISDNTAITASTPPGPVLAELGFTSAEAYEAYVSSLSESQFWNHMVDVLAAIERLGLN